MTECNSRMNRRIEEIEHFLADSSVGTLSMTMFTGEKRRLQKFFNSQIEISAIAKTDTEGLVKYKIVKTR